MTTAVTKMTVSTGASPAETDAGKARVTIVMTQRDRFSLTPQSVESLFAATSMPFRFVYVDGGSPRHIARWLEAEAARRPAMELIRHDRYLTPTEARNIGVRAASTEFVVFVDNDVFFTDGWLEALVTAADETGAEAINPFTCQSDPLHTIAHHTRTQFADDPAAFFAAPHGERPYAEKIFDQGKPVDELLPTVTRFDMQFCEFHTLLVRRDLLERLGPFDEALSATKENIDFSLRLYQAGARIVFEPSSIVTFLYPTRQRPIALSDYPYFMFRWSPARQKRDLAYLKSKWGLRNDTYFADRQRFVYFRIYEGILRPYARRVPLIGHRGGWHYRLQSLFGPILDWVSLRIVAVQEARAGTRAAAQPQARASS